MRFYLIPKPGWGILSGQNRCVIAAFLKELLLMKFCKYRGKLGGEFRDSKNGGIEECRLVDVGSNSIALVSVFDGI